eukprot:scaffold182247_cov15-Tisochrysis_lutea.AAC.1
MEGGSSASFRALHSQPGAERGHVPLRVRKGGILLHRFMHSSSKTLNCSDFSDDACGIWTGLMEGWMQQGYHCTVIPANACRHALAHGGLAAAKLSFAQQFLWSPLRHALTQ